MIGRRTVIAGGIAGGSAIAFRGLARGAVPVSLADAGTAPTVSTDKGPVTGQRINGVRVFTGIPFAKPPIGPLRFKAPVEADAWTAPFDATKPAANPIQGADALAGSEDCLQLNVWAPDGPGPYPVFVWIYGGGNIGGGISRPMYDGATFAQAGIVCVCINYRLGALGFLELGELTGETGTANNAIRDQLLGLQWVQKNIRSFGGDPARVTLGGQSAGAGDATVLLTLPAAKGLFHRIVLASGGGGSVGSTETAHAYARVFADKLGGKDKLRSASAQDILKAQNAARAAGGAGIRPMLDGSFIAAQPMDAIRRGDAKNVPMMTGWTRDENLNFQSLDSIGRISIADRNLAHFAPARRAQLVADYAKAFPGLSVAERNLKIISADLIKLPTQQIIDAQAGHGATVHAYELAYVVPGGKYGDHCVHGADVPLIFNRLSTPFARDYGYTANDMGVARQVQGAYIAFIKGAPMTLARNPWPRYNEKARPVMVIDHAPHVAQDPDKAERSIWAELGT